MPSSLATQSVSVVTAEASAVETDILFLPVFEGEDPGEPCSRASASRPARRSAGPCRAKEFQGKPFELFMLPVVSGWKAARVALIGCGRSADAGMERLRRVAGAAAMAARQRRLPRVAILNRGLDRPRDAAQAIAEGLVLASYSGDIYKSGERGGPPRGADGRRRPRASPTPRPWNGRSSAAGSSASRATSPATSATSPRTC